MFPTVSEYNQTIQSKGGSALKTLFNLTFLPSRVTPIRIYSYGSGAFAVVFKAKNELGNQYAIRCFISAEGDKIERYREVSNYLRKIDATWTTEFELLEHEINVGTKSYPIIKMDWVEGELLNDYIGHILHDNKALTELQKQLVKVSKSLEKHKVGHGDIQCGNIIVSKNDKGDRVVKLIDYDGMYVPQLSWKHSLERGLTEFQHPKRSHLHYDEKIDRFSFWVIICAIEALKYDKNLWLEVMQGGFNTLQNTLFVGQDFINFDNSTLIQRLNSLNKPSLSFYLSKLRAFCDSLPENVEAVEMFKRLDKEQENHNFIESEATFSPNTDFVKILSSPSGATVLNSAFQKIGTTPCFLDRDEYINKTVRVAYDSQYTTIFIDKNKQEIWANFHSEKPVIVNKAKITSNPLGASVFYNSQEIGVTPFYINRSEYLNKTLKVTHGNRFTTIFIDEAKLEVCAHFPPENTPITKVQPQPPQDEWVKVVIFVIALFVIVLVIIGISKNNNYTPITDNTSVTVDTTASVDTLASVDTIASIDELPNVEVDTASVINTSVYTPEVISKIFLLSLNKSDCQSAWNVTLNPVWEKKGKVWFCSSQAYGGVNKVDILEVTEIQNNGLEAVVYVKYYAEDIYNGNGSYTQHFKLKYMGVNWYIVKIINADIN